MYCQDNTLKTVLHQISLQMIIFFIHKQKEIISAFFFMREKCQVLNSWIKLSLLLFI